jgi:hypothetical protein
MLITRGLATTSEKEYVLFDDLIFTIEQSNEIETELEFVNELDIVVERESNIEIEININETFEFICEV